MVDQSRPRMGTYEILQEFVADEMSFRIFRLKRDAQIVDRHLHRRTTQFYVGLDGTVLVECDDTSVEIVPYDCVRVGPGAVHRASPAGDTAVVLNISVPPVQANDQILEAGLRAQ